MAKNLNGMNKTTFNPKNMGNMGDINQQIKIIQDFLKKKQ
jgi:hypothetical protein